MKYRRPIPPSQLLIDEGIREFFEELEEAYSAYLEMEELTDRFGLWSYEPLDLEYLDKEPEEDEGSWYVGLDYDFPWTMYKYDYDPFELDFVE